MISEAPVIPDLVLNSDIPLTFNQTKTDCWKFIRSIKIEKMVFYLAMTSIITVVTFFPEYLDNNAFGQNIVSSEKLQTFKFETNIKTSFCDKICSNDKNNLLEKQLCISTCERRGRLEFIFIFGLLFLIVLSSVLYILIKSQNSLTQNITSNFRYLLDRIKGLFSQFNNSQYSEVNTEVKNNTKANKSFNISDQSTINETRDLFDLIENEDEQDSICFDSSHVVVMNNTIVSLNDSELQDEEKEEVKNIVEMKKKGYNLMN